MSLVNEQVLELYTYNYFGKIIKSLRDKNDINIISYQEFTSLVKMVVEKILRITVHQTELDNSRCLCEIRQLRSSLRGEVIANINIVKVTLNEDVIKRLYYGDILELLNIFHELEHVKVKCDILQGKINFHIVRILKESLLCSLGGKDSNNIIVEKEIFFNRDSAFRDYYDDNYKLFSEEKWVEMSAIYDFLKFIQYFDIDLLETEKEQVETSFYKNDYEYQNYIRDVRCNMNFNDYFIDFEEAFDIMIKKHPEWLGYLQLQIEYYLDESGNVIKRSKEQLLEMLKMETDIDRIKCIEKLLKDNKRKRLDKTELIDNDEKYKFNNYAYKKVLCNKEFFKEKFGSY